MKPTRKIAILTSGGDAPGMNASIRGAVRAALQKGWCVYGIRDGYRGLAAGGEYIIPLDWVDVSWNFREGGTFLGSARLPQLQDTNPASGELKSKALANLQALNITGLVIIGGDGSLTGGYALHCHLQKILPESGRGEDGGLSIVGIPGSIDNDIASTDMAIGVDTTLNTIVECVDKLRDTATSHRRVIIVEVMGRRRGYLAVMSGLATGADSIFIREEGIQQHQLNGMLGDLTQSFGLGQKASIIIRAEGAPVSTGYLKETISVFLEPKREVRETVLGHLQRGGIPTVFERTLATRMGIKAIEVLAEGYPEPQMLGLAEKEIRPFSLAHALAQINTTSFQERLSPNTEAALALARELEQPPRCTAQGMKIALITDGSNVSGMNMAIRAAARRALNQGIEVKGIRGGLNGLLRARENAISLEWSMLEMKSILRRAGTLLGVSSSDAQFKETDLSPVAEELHALGISGVIVIGNKHTYHSACRLFPAMKIPALAIPAAFNCRLPGTDWVIGMDSALNDLLRDIDRAADAAHVTRRIFIIHLKGDYCSCLVSLAALAGGAELLLIDEEGPEAANRDAFQSTVHQRMGALKRMIDLGKTFATIVFFSSHAGRAEGSLEFIRKAMRDQGITREVAVIPLETSLGGIVPTAFDRILAKRLGAKALDVLLEKIRARDHTLHAVGLVGKSTVTHAYEEHAGAVPLRCSRTYEDELRDTCELMSQPGRQCSGMGGTVEWTGTGQEKQWQGIWRCSQCGRAQPFSCDTSKMHLFSCSNDSCSNYGYLRISRRL